MGILCHRGGGDGWSGLVPGWSRDSQSNSGVRGYSATGVVVMAGLVPGWSRDCQSNSGVRGYSATGVVVAGLVPGWSRDSQSGWSSPWMVPGLSE